MRDQVSPPPVESWPTTAVHDETEELRVHYWGLSAERARGFLSELLAAGRIPPKVPTRGCSPAIAGACRLWLSLEPDPEGPYLVVLWQDDCWIRAIGHKGSPDQGHAVDRSGRDP